jgi:hypothetical protein
MENPADAMPRIGDWIVILLDLCRLCAVNSLRSMGTAHNSLDENNHPALRVRFLFACLG